MSLSTSSDTSVARYRGVARNIERGFLNVCARENNINIHDLSAKLRVVSRLINRNCVACCNMCCNSLDSSTFASVFRRVVTIEERSILFLTSLVNGT